MAEARNFSELANLDVFFYYGQVGVDHETEHDIALGLLQSKRSLYYNREDSAGVAAYENLPNGIYSVVVLRFDIASWIARRNRRVGDGQNGTLDRRVATSQSIIDIQQNGDEMDVIVPFVKFADLQQPTKLTVPIGG